MPDLHVDNHGTIYLLTPESDAGREWVNEHISPEAPRWGHESIVVEHRFIGDIVDGATNDGMTVE